MVILSENFIWRWQMLPLGNCITEFPFFFFYNSHLPPLNHFHVAYLTLASSVSNCFVLVTVSCTVVTHSPQVLGHWSSKRSVQWMKCQQFWMMKLMCSHLDTWALIITNCSIHHVSPQTVLLLSSYLAFGPLWLWRQQTHVLIVWTHHIFPSFLPVTPLLTFPPPSHLLPIWLTF